MKRALQALSHVQAALLLGLLYVLVLLPLGLLVRLQDPLRTRPGPGSSPRKTVDPTLERFSHPF